MEKAREHLQRANPDQLRQFELLLELPRSARALMDQTLNDEKYVTGDNIELLVESVVEAAGREGAEKEKAKRIKETGALKGKLLQTEEALAAEREAARLQELAHQEHLSALQARDAATLDGTTGRLSKKFVKTRRYWRMGYFVAALVPLISFVLTIGGGKPNLALGAVAAIAVIFGIPLVMDRPGAWLTKIIQRRITDRFESDLHDLGREDLLDAVVLSWNDEGLNWAWRAKKPETVSGFDLEEG